MICFFKINLEKILSQTFVLKLKIVCVCNTAHRNALKPQKCKYILCVQHKRASRHTCSHSLPLFPILAISNPHTELRLTSLSKKEEAAKAKDQPQWQLKNCSGSLGRFITSSLILEMQSTRPTTRLRPAHSTLTMTVSRRETESPIRERDSGEVIIQQSRQLQQCGEGLRDRESDGIWSDHTQQLACKC